MKLCSQFKLCAKTTTCLEPQKKVPLAEDIKAHHHHCSQNSVRLLTMREKWVSVRVNIEFINFHQL